MAERIESSWSLITGKNAVYPSLEQSVLYGKTTAATCDVSRDDDDEQDEDVDVEGGFDANDSDDNREADEPLKEEERKEENGNEDKKKIFAVPSQEIIIDRDTIGEDEKIFHGEYFEGKEPKTPDRYVKIRNHILDAWEKTKPKYLNKTAVRSGLKNCGDVNCIGKIHEYLEMRGAINFGCIQALYNRMHDNEQKPMRSKTAIRLEEHLPRKRLRTKRKFTDGEVAGSNYTIRHSPLGDVIESDFTLQSKKERTMRRNPFQLIRCVKFPSDEKDPYEVCLNVSVLIAIDVHAHLYQCEVIGLLGGRYDAERHFIELMVAEPCLVGQSSAVQCEMDPVSQSEASIAMEEIGMSVLGWYHSHPTFSPDPSIRDLETQAKYQTWFSQRCQPFVAIIVNPYCIGSLNSCWRCFIVDDDIEENDFAQSAFRQPLELSITSNSKDFDEDSCLRRIKRLNEEVPGTVDAILLNDLYNDQTKITYFDKMMESVRHHASYSGLQSDQVQRLYNEIREIFYSQK